MKASLLYILLLLLPIVTTPTMQTSTDTIKTVLDQTYSLEAIIIIEENPEACYGRKVQQQIQFFRNNILIHSINPDTLSPLQTKTPMLCPYEIATIATDSIGNQKFYILNFALLANGEPEINLYYTPEGELLFSTESTNRSFKYNLPPPPPLTEVRG
ncbi:MAG: hypothetical protein LIP01_04100 [Tannerellaceae bacterium]|nr:hypothetical protein [Tannerellaceae bacterium]